MLAVPVSVASTPAGGPRPTNLNKDYKQVVELLDLAFGPLASGRGQRMLVDTTRPNFGAPFGSRLGALMQGHAPGYVWEEDGRVVGTLSLLRSSTPGRFLVANVAIHPDYRRLGIATGLMTSTTDYVRSRGGREILLQVELDNEAATDLYNRLDFDTLGEVNRWESSSSRLRSISTPSSPQARIRSLMPSDERAAYALDLRCMPADLHWPDPPSRKKYQTSIWRRIGDFFYGRRSKSWVIDVPLERRHKRRLVGLASIESEWSRPHELGIRVAPEWRGQLERLLLVRLIAQVKQNRAGRIRLSHLAHDDKVNGLLREANFRVKRSLRIMRLNLQRNS